MFLDQEHDHKYPAFCGQLCQCFCQWTGSQIETILLSIPDRTTVTMESSISLAVTSLMLVAFFPRLGLPMLGCYNCASKEMRLLFLFIGSCSFAAQYTAFNPTSTVHSFSLRAFLTAYWNSLCLASALKVSTWRQREPPELCPISSPFKCHSPPSFRHFKSR